MSRREKNRDRNLESVKMREHVRQRERLGELGVM